MMKVKLWLLAVVAFLALHGCGDDPDDVEAEGKKPSPESSDDAKGEKPSPDSPEDEEDCRVISKLDTEAAVEACAEEERMCGTVRLLSGNRCCIIGGNCG